MIIDHGQALFNKKFIFIIIQKWLAIDKILVALIRIEGTSNFDQNCGLYKGLEGWL